MKTWMNKTLLAVSVQMILGVAYAAEEPSLGGYETVGETIEVEQAAEQTQEQIGSDQTSAPEQPAKSASVTTGSVEQAASSALQQQEGDATKETNLEEVFTSNERQYSLIKQGDISSYYDIDYTYYRDTQLDLEMAQGQLYQLRVQENATHSLTNTFTAQYGLRDNLTLTASLPLVAKTDLLKDTSTAGLGDISFGARWEPFPLKAGRLPLILFGNVSTKTGDSPYEINATSDLATGKGYYSAGVGASTRKYIDPVVLFASVSANYGFKESGLDQRRGSRVIEEFEPGISGGFAFGFAYSFNYDVSMTMSYQQSFNTGAEFTYSSGESYSPADQTSSTFAISLGVRVSPETIVNGTVGLGLTEDAPDVSLGLSFPLDILGFGKKLK
ncbi:putative pilus assembly protein (FilC) [Acinetobacter sp. 8I-beige]|nr:putative pilus assembly protein (FilC) [Acinetobacter sp. 8I-beige]